MKATLEKKEKGFALIEVMMAALVLTVGCLAFLKLQHKGLQYSFNDYARSQGVAITQGFVERLRGNTAFLNAGIADGSISNGDKTLANALSTATSACGASKPNKTCAKAMFDYQKYLTAQQMQTAMKGQSRLCYLHNNDTRGLRLTFMWIDSTASEDAKKDGIEEDNCPDNFGDAVEDDFIDNSVTIYATL